MRCVTGKRMYTNQDLAEDALIEARTAFDYAAGSGPVAVYRCDDCGNYHLTSRGPMNDKLARFIAEGKLDRQKEANRWLDKFKNR